MRRLFWVAVGVGTTVIVLRKISKISAATAAFAPANLAESVGRLAESLSSSAAEFRAVMAEQEERLTEALLPSDADAGRAGRRTSAGRRSGGGYADASTDSWGLDSDDPDLYL